MQTRIQSKRLLYRGSIEALGDPGIEQEVPAVGRYGTWDQYERVGG